MEGKLKEPGQQIKIGPEVPREEPAGEGRWWLREKIQERWDVTVVPRRSNVLEL